ncbi:MAG: polyprenyl synthetase family protein [Paludibacter sp.]|jgi:geranylgeranyl diphosphate synthase type II|nr:polyprenyl synthetase family protein [Paludibacter sp.]
MLSFQDISEIINTAIAELPFPAQPARLYEPIRYTMALGGKRIRPAMALMACNIFSDDSEKAVPAALALEIFHNFTLLHDDIMDNAPIRRGKPTVHSRWDSNTAILSGDAMQILAYQHLSALDSNLLPTILPIFNTMALEICEGQQLDMDFETRNDVTIEQYIEMIRLKTAVLLGSALKIGALIGGAKPSDADDLYRFGVDTGLAFQLQDDLLDVYGDQNTFGKQIGSDILCNKKTFMLITAQQNANNTVATELQKWLAAKPNEEKIQAITKIYDTINVKTICEEKIRHFHNIAFAALDEISATDEKKSILRKFSVDLLNRNK